MAIGDEEAIESALGLGELAGLTITNEADVLTSGYNVILLLVFIHSPQMSPIEYVGYMSL